MFGRKKFVYVYVGIAIVTASCQDADNTGFETQSSALDETYQWACTDSLVDSFSAPASAASKFQTPITTTNGVTVDDYGVVHTILSKDGVVSHHSFDSALGTWSSTALSRSVSSSSQSVSPSIVRLSDGSLIASWLRKDDTFGDDVEVRTAFGQVTGAGVVAWSGISTLTAAPCAELSSLTSVGCPTCNVDAVVAWTANATSDCSSAARDEIRTQDYVQALRFGYNPTGTSVTVGPVKCLGDGAVTNCSNLSALGVGSRDVSVDAASSHAVIVWEQDCTSSSPAYDPASPDGCLVDGLPRYLRRRTSLNSALSWSAANSVDDSVTGVELKGEDGSVCVTQDNIFIGYHSPDGTVAMTQKPRGTSLNSWSTQDIQSGWFANVVCRGDSVALSWELTESTPQNDAVKSIGVAHSTDAGSTYVLSTSYGLSGTYPHTVGSYETVPNLYLRADTTTVEMVWRHWDSSNLYEMWHRQGSLTTAYICD